MHVVLGLLMEGAPPGVQSLTTLKGPISLGHDNSLQPTLNFIMGINVVHVNFQPLRTL